MKEKIHQIFRKPYNCAQTVLKILKTEHTICAEDIHSAKANGSGRAPNGTCGALYAILSQLPENKHSQAIESFKAEATSEKCREIRRNQKLSCQGCVEKALTLFAEIHK
jgi:hypothetical protein